VSLIVCDFETFFDSEYSLSTGEGTTEAYIRDPRFEVICVSVIVDGGAPQWFTGTHAEIYQWLRQFNWEGSVCVFHNAMFDAAILSWRFGIRPGAIICTMSMARPLLGQAESVSLGNLASYFGVGTKGDDTRWAKGMRRVDFQPHQMQQYASYCCLDSQLCLGILRKMMPGFPKSELQLIDSTIRCFTEPQLELDLPILERELQAFLTRRNGLLEACGVSHPSELRSDGLMAEKLTALGVVPPTKPSKADPDVEAWAFSKQDVEFMDLREHEDERVVALVEARIGSKTSQVQTRLERFINIAKRGRLPVPLSYAGAMTTHRWSGTDKINLQNLPRNPNAKKGLFSPLRQAIKAPPGFKLMVADLSQIELRLNCWQSGQQDVLDLLIAGEDVYAHSASATYGFKVDKDNYPIERFVGKTQELSCGYQCGPARFRNALRTDSRKYGIHLPDESLEFAKKAVYGYRDSHPAIVNFWARAEAAIPYLASGMGFDLGPWRCDQGTIIMPSGLRLSYPDLCQRLDEKTGRLEWQYARRREKSRNRIVTKLYGGKLVENVTQAAGKCVMAEAMLRIAQRFRIVGTVHDELILLVPADIDLVEAKAWVRWCMTQSPVWAPTLPLACDIEIGDNYAEAK
jgi:DNA polymerase